MEDKQGVPITTEDMLQVIGELFIQTRVLQKMLRIKQEAREDGAIKGSEVSSC